MFQPGTLYEFGPFRVEARERRLLRNGEVVTLTPKVFDILLLLVQNSGHILSKEEVMRLVWPSTVVEEGNIARNISTLRRALGDAPSGREYIETVPWRGYRFAANVKVLTDQDIRPALTSVAVLPFTNLTADQAKEYLSDGIAESLINNLGHMRTLKVMSHNSTFRYKARDADVRKIGRDLNVRTVLMGRIAEHDDLLSISVELVDTADESHIWGAQYGRKVSDIFTFQQTLAREVAESLRLHLTGEEEERLGRRQTNNTSAYQNYLKGRYYFNKLTPEGVEKALKYLEQAISEDPNYALAFAGVGDCYTYSGKSAEARSAFVKALELDHTLGEAHASLGFFKFLYEWDWAAAEEEFKQAISLKSSYAEAHHWYAIYLAHMGRPKEAATEASLAKELDPLSLLMNMTPGLTLYLAREYEQAIATFQKVLEMETNFMAGRSMLAHALEQNGNHKQAIAEYKRLLETCGPNAEAQASLKALLARSYALAGHGKRAFEIIEEVTKEHPATDCLMAQVYCALGEKDQAFSFLEKAFQKRDIQLVGLKTDPAFDSLRADHRFGALLYNMHL